jgi:hypothetical protein
MGDYWLRALEAAEAAEDAAKRLRQRYGREAEAHVKEASRAANPQVKPPLQADDVRRALRWT